MRNLVVHVEECENFSPKNKGYKVTPRIDEPGRIRVVNVMALFAVSRSSVYKRTKDGRIPKPDGYDPRPYWYTSSVRPFLGRIVVDSGKPVSR